MDDGHGQEEYVRQVLEAYRKTPGTMGTVRRADRTLADLRVSYNRLRRESITADLVGVLVAGRVRKAGSDDGS